MSDSGYETVEEDHNGENFEVMTTTELEEAGVTQEFLEQAFAQVSSIKAAKPQPKRHKKSTNKRAPDCHIEHLQ